MNGCFVRGSWVTSVIPDKPLACFIQSQSDVPKAQPRFELMANETKGLSILAGETRIENELHGSTRTGNESQKRAVSCDRPIWRLEGVTNGQDALSK